MDELDRRLAASRDRLRDRIVPPPVGHIIARARRRRTQRRAQVAVVGLVAALAIAVPVASLVGGQHRTSPAGPASTGPAATAATTVTVTTGPSVPRSTARSGASEASDMPGPTGSATPVTAPTTINAGEPILNIGDGYELFARSPDAVARIQFAKGLVTARPTPPIASGAGAFFLVGRHAVIARAWDYVPGFLLPDDGPATDLPGRLSGGGGYALPGPGPDQVWVEHSSNGAESGVDALQLVGFDGTTTSTSIPMSGPPLAPDGAGYVLVRGADCLYDVDPDGRTCIASGPSPDLVAIGPTGWLLHPCDADQRCTDVYVDRATGTKHRTGVDVDPEHWGRISPDGSYAAVLEAAQDDSGTTTLHLIGLSTGTERRVELAAGAATGQPAYGSDIAWSPDSRWLFVATGRVQAVDPATGRTHALLVPGVADYLQLGVRPAHPDGAGS